MRWECPFETQRRHQCRLFDGRCEPGSEGCLLSESPFFEPSDDEPVTREVPTEPPLGLRTWHSRRPRTTKTAP
jgi:hypothetical protein